MKTLLVSLVLLCCGAAAASAQGTTESHGYVAGGFTLAWQPDEDPDGSRYLSSSTLGGLSAGLHLGGGGHLSNGFSAGVEVSLPGAVSGQREQWTIGHVIANYEVQETMITGLGRGHIGRGRVQFQPMGGFTWVRTRTRLVDGYSQTPIGTIMPLPPAERTDLEIGITGGVDVAAALSAHVALSPYARLHLVRRPDPAKTPEWSMLPGVVYRFGVVLVGRW